MFTSFPNFALFVFICQFQGFFFHYSISCNSMYMPNARVSVCTVRRPACWKELLCVNAGPQTPLEALSVDFLDWSHCTWELGIARDQDFCGGAIIFSFCGKLCRIGQDHAEPGEKQDH